MLFVAAALVAGPGRGCAIARRLLQLLVLRSGRLTVPLWNLLHGLLGLLTVCFTHDPSVALPSCGLRPLGGGIGSHHHHKSLTTGINLIVQLLLEVVDLCDDI